MKKPLTKAVPLLICFVVLLLVIFKSPLMQIKKITTDLHGVDCVSEQQIRVDNSIKQNILLFDHQKVRQLWLQQYPCIGQVIFHRRFPNQLVIDLYPRVPFIQVSGFIPKVLPSLDNAEASISTATALFDWSFPVASLAGILIADQQGVVITNREQANLPLLYYPESEIKVGQQLNLELFTNLALIMDKLSALASPVSQVRFDGQSLLLQTQQKVVLSFPDDINRQLASLQLILSKAKIDGKAMDKIDLRFDKPVVIYFPTSKPKDQQAVIRQGD